MVDWDLVVKVLDIVEFLVNLDVYRKWVVVVRWKVLGTMVLVIFDVFVFFEDGDLVIFMELVVVFLEVFLVGRVMVVEVDKVFVVNVVVFVMDVFKKFGVVIVFRSGGVVLEYDRVVWLVVNIGMFWVIVEEEYIVFCGLSLVIWGGVVKFICCERVVFVFWIVVFLEIIEKLESTCYFEFSFRN